MCIRDRAALNQPLQDYRDYLEDQVGAYQRARDLLLTAFRECPVPQGGAYLYVPFESGEAAWSAMMRWLEQGVSSAPGSAFGGLHPHCLRLCFTATGIEKLEQAVEIIKRVG